MVQSCPSACALHAHACPLTFGCVTYRLWSLNADHGQGHVVSQVNAAALGSPPLVFVSPGGTKMTAHLGAMAVDVYALPPYQVDARFCVYSHKTRTVSAFTRDGVFLHYKLSSA